MKFCMSWHPLSTVGPRPLVRFGLNQVLVVIVPECQYCFTVMPCLKTDDFMKRGIRLISELDIWFKLVVFSIYRDRQRHIQGKIHRDSPNDYFRLILWFSGESWMKISQSKRLHMYRHLFDISANCFFVLSLSSWHLHSSQGTSGR